MTAQSSEDYHCIISPALSLYTFHNGVKLLTSCPIYLQFGFFNSSGSVTEMRAFQYLRHKLANISCLNITSCTGKKDIFFK